MNEGETQAKQELHVPIVNAQNGAKSYLAVLLSNLENYSGGGALYVQNKFAKISTLTILFHWR
jgi:hypothetical protein